MNQIYVCFSLKSFSTSLASVEEIENDYQNVYKPLAKFLYSHPEFSFTLSLSGTQLQYYKKKRNEIITILKQLIDRKQVELLGGGFYDPILPLLYPVDRNGQVDMLSAEIRQTLGKRPRGISLYADCWDSSLVNSLQTCGIEYILLDSSIINPDKRKYLQLIMSDLGKSIDILPYYDNLLPSPSESIKEFVQKLVKTVERTEKKDNYFQYKAARVVNLNISHELFLELLQNNWFENLSNYLMQNDTRINLSTPIQYRKLDEIKLPVYVPAGINNSIAKWIGQAFTEVERKQNYPVTVYDFMNTYPQSHDLYNRIMYVSMLVNQYKVDKMRKNAAREKLWQAQNGAGLLCTSKGTFSNSKYRQKSYKNLMEAEKILREGTGFKESVTCFDYDSDGFNEYVCRMQNYFSYITLYGGTIQELEILKNTGNYVDNLSRFIDYDGCTDDYKRGLFVDHVFTSDEFEKYKKGIPAGDGVFSKIRYSELKYIQNHHEVQLSANAIFTPTKQELYLRKKYIINSTGMNVQYILRNESDKPLKAILAIENNFAHTNFDSDNIVYYNIEAVDNENKVDIDSTKSTEKLNNKNKLNNVSIIRITDVESGISFGLEPNENCKFCYYPLIFKRPDFNGIDLVPVHMTFVNTLFWNVEIEPGKETERTINFTITSVKKERKSR